VILGAKGKYKKGE
jgi:hypothetical protein